MLKKREKKGICQSVHIYKKKKRQTVRVEQSEKKKKAIFKNEMGSVEPSSTQTYLL